MVAKGSNAGAIFRKTMEGPPAARFSDDRIVATPPPGGGRFSKLSQAQPARAERRSFARCSAARSRSNAQGGPAHALQTASARDARREPARS